MSVATSSTATASRQRHERAVRLDFPLPRTHTGFPLGNGLFGALVWGEGGTLCVTVNRSDFWDRRSGELVPGENLYEQLNKLYDPDDAHSMDAPFKPTGLARPDGEFRNTRLPMGRFEFTLQPGLSLRHGALDVLRGELVLWVDDGEPDGSGAHLRLALHPTRSVLRLHDPSGAVAAMRPRPAWEWLGETMRTRGYEPPMVEDSADDQVGWAQAVPEDPAMAALCQRSDDALWIAMTAGEDAPAAHEQAVQIIKQVRDADSDSFLESVHQWWANYWRDLPRVTLPDEFFSDFLNLALFKFGAATSPQSATSCGLQGPWCEEYQLPPWSGDYHFNVNIQQIYTLALATGKVEHLLPLFDMLDRNMPVFREQARRMVGIEDGLLMTHTTDDCGHAAGGVGPGAVIDQAVSGWTAQLYWLYYRHAGDRVFLRNRAMPFMAGVMRVFEAMLEWHDDKPTLPIGISAEYGHPLPDGSRQRVGPNPSYQFACMHMLCNALIEGAEVLGEEPNPTWRAIHEALPPFTLVGEPGDERIAIWEDQDLDISHRHHSHLACIYPFDTLHERNEQTQTIVERSLERWLEVGMSDWSEWCLPWAAIIEAREGYTEGPHALLKLCRELYMNEGLATVYIPRFEGIVLHALQRKTGPLETCEMMQLDGTMGFATAVYEMLAHLHRGVVRFFPAVPEAWRDVSFEGVHLPGPLLVDGEKRDGEVRRIAVRSESGGQICLDVPGYRQLTLRRGKTTKQVALPTTLTLHAGEAVEGTPSR